MTTSQYNLRMTAGWITFVTGCTIYLFAILFAAPSNADPALSLEDGWFNGEEDLTQAQAIQLYNTYMDLLETDKDDSIIKDIAQQWGVQTPVWLDIVTMLNGISYDEGIKTLTIDMTLNATALGLTNVDEWNEVMYDSSLFQSCFNPILRAFVFAGYKIDNVNHAFDHVVPDSNQLVTDVSCQIYDDELRNEAKDVNNI